MAKLPVERKVTTGGLSAAILSFTMSLILTVWPGIPDTISTPLSAVIAGMITGAGAYAVAWLTKHTNRTDPEAARGPHK
jgi:hypothetical protein